MVKTGRLCNSQRKCRIITSAIKLSARHSGPSIENKDISPFSGIVLVRIALIPIILGIITIVERDNAQK